MPVFKDPEPHGEEKYVINSQSLNKLKPWTSHSWRRFYFYVSKTTQDDCQGIYYKYI
jgi:hypothetical protein